MALPSAVEIERAGLKAWPGLEVEWDGAWVRRAANGYTQRANSVQSYDPGDDGNAEARIAASAAWYAARGQQPIYRITPLAGRRFVDALDADGWASIDHSQVMAMELGPVEADPRGEVLDLADARFLAAQQKLRFYSDERLGKLRAVLAVIKVPAKGIVLHSGAGAPVATALMAVADGIVITGNVITDPAERRKGYGAAMMRTGLAWARESGAGVAALNVATDNAAGQALYAGLGYRPHYSYVYRVPGQE